MTVVRSPFFYVGDKFKLVDQLLPLFPDRVEKYVEPFLGGGSVLLNYSGAEGYFGSDIDDRIIGLHRRFSAYGSHDDLIEDLSCMIRKYGLTFSAEGVDIPKELLIQYPKTYFAKMNESSYSKMKSDYNESSERDPLHLFLLVIYGFNRMWRFNSKGFYNIPVGNVDFNSNVVQALENYVLKVSQKHAQFSAGSFEEEVNKHNLTKNDFVYLDPPYLITGSEYNKIWNEDRERNLLQYLDHLNSKKVKFALSNVTDYRGKENPLLKDWMTKYSVHDLKSKYINYFDNGNKASREVLVTNYDK